MNHESSRRARGTLWLESALADIRYSLRATRRSPAFAAAAIVTLALGIGANTAIFGVLNAVFLRPLPYPHPERLVWASEYFPRFKRDQMFIPEYASWRRQSTAFEHLEAYGIAIGVNLTAGNRPAERVRAGHVTPGFFTMLGVQPRIGRAFAPQDARAAILSDALWRDYFKGDLVLGQSVDLNGVPFAIVGVMPPGFLDPGGAGTAIWVPDAVDAKSSVPGRGMRLLGGVIGRLKPGATPASARANLELLARRMDGAYPGPWSTYHAVAHARVVPLQDQLTAGSRTAIAVLMGAVAFILLIVCANVSNMFLSRAVSRERELALRAAIGASRARLVRLLLAESLALGTCGGVAGIALMYAATSTLAFVMPDAVPHRIPVDFHVLGFAAFCSLATGILFGLAPALKISRLDLNTTLKEGGAHAMQHRRGVRFRAALAVAQVALSLVLLIGAGLLVRSFLALLRVNPGFDPHHVLLAEVSLSPRELYGPVRQSEFFHRALDAIQAIPGVEQAAVTDESPLATFQSLMSGISGEGQPPTSLAVVPASISAGYFTALRIPLLAGRDFDGRDRAEAARVVILNQALAGALFPNLDPVGRRVNLDDAKGPATVVGLVADIRHRGLDDKTWPELYLPYQQAPTPWMSFVIRSSGDPARLAPAVRRAVAAIEAGQPLFDIQSLDQRLSGTVAERRRRAGLLASFAALALVIALVGVYGVMAYSVARRTHEMGVRIALGAQPRAIVRMVVGEGMRIALAGVILGVAGALALTRVLAGFLFAMTPTDLPTFLSLSLLLLAAAFLAAWLPSRRATRVDPMVALRVA